MKNGESVAAFEKEFAAYVGARFGIALNSGTSTLHTALVALGVKPGDRVAVPPLTMSATTIAVLHAGAVPVFVDVDQDTWVMGPLPDQVATFSAIMPVALYGLNDPWAGGRRIVDAAQTLQPHHGAAFTSYSFQASKILPLGEGGMLVTNDEELATRAREFSSLGYRMRADQPRIDPAVLKSPTYERHHSLGWNYRMADIVANEGLTALSEGWADSNKAERRSCAAMYADAIAGCSWLTPQHVPEGWAHSWWTYAVAVEVRRDRGDETAHCALLSHAITRHGGERPYPAWQLTYREPAFRYLVRGQGYRWVDREDAYPFGVCPVAEDLQPRLLQFQTNNLASAEKNANALRLAIRELGG